MMKLIISKEIENDYGTVEELTRYLLGKFQHPPSFESTFLHSACYR